MTYKLLLLEGMTDRGQAVLDAEGWVLDQKKAMPPAELAKIIGEYDAVTIRSGTKFTAEVVAAAKKLRVIGRPGVGVDNVDVEAATKAGIFVMNSLGGNLVSTCELTMALILATSRNIGAADASLKAGTWDRKAFAGGTEIAGKRIGVVGFGRIGREVAARCKAFGMEVWAFDPFVSAQVAERVGVKAVTLDQILTGCDYITLHTVMTPDTRHMLGKEAFAKIKPGVRIINAARGELIDEDALFEALESGRVAGCGLDVHAKEPPVDWKIAKHPKVVATPHIGAQTVEAQDRVGTDIAYQVRDFLKDGVIQQAVNFFQLSGEAYDQIKPAIDLGERLAHEAFDEIPVHRAADLAACGQSETRARRRGVLEGVDQQQATTAPTPLSIAAKVVLRAPQTLVRTEPLERHRPGVSGLRRSGACGRDGGAEQELRGHSWCACGPGIRASSCGDDCSVETCASR